MARKTLKERLEAFRLVDNSTGCWLFSGYKNDKGYGMIGVTAGRPRLVHRVSYEMFVGQIPTHPEVCHSCDVRGCFNPEHLYLGTHQDNMDDCAAKDRFAKGNAIALAKLDEPAVRSIKARLASGESQKSLATAYRVHHSSISGIKRGVTWKHVS